MKVVQVLFSGLGGHASVAFSMVDGDRDMQWDHHLIFYGIEPMNSEHEEKARQRSLSFDMVLAIEGKPAKTWRKFYQGLKNASPDVILLHSNSLTIPAWWYCCRHGKKLVIVEHTPNQVKRKIDKWTSILGQYVGDSVVLLTDDYYREMKEMQGWHFKNKKVRVIPNGIDTSLFKPAPKLKQDSLFHLGMAARFSNTKSQDLLVKVMRQLENSSPGKYKLSLAGDGDELNRVKQLAKELELSDCINFTGSLDEKKLIPFLQQLDIYLHASKGETMSTSIMQAMSCGLPVIASDIPGINNLVANNGVVVENSESSFVNAIMRLSVDEMQMRTFANDANRYAESHFSNVRMFDSYNALVKQLCGGTGSGNW